MLQVRTDTSCSDQLPNRQFKFPGYHSSIQERLKRVGSLDKMLVVVNGRAFRQNGDSSLSLEIVAVHGPRDES